MEVQYWRWSSLWSHGCPLWALEVSLELWSIHHRAVEVINDLPIAVKAIGAHPGATEAVEVHLEAEGIILEPRASPWSH